MGSESKGRAALSRPARPVRLILEPVAAYKPSVQTASSTAEA